MDLSGWVGVGLGGKCDCRFGILYRPKHVVFSIANKHHHIAIYL